jgi:phosphate transport system substrate-binding protein
MRLHQAILPVLIGALLVSCSSGSSTNTNTSTTSSGSTISIAGSTALQPLVEKASQDYMRAHPDITIKVAGGGSGTGLAALFSNTIDVADSDIEAPSMKDATDHQVAVAPFAVVVGPNVSIKNLTKAQIHDIFSGKIKSWKEVGGANLAVVPINRALTSGTRKVFATILMGGTEPATSKIEESSDKLAEFVKNTAGSISYVSLSFAQKFNLPTLAIDGVTPELKNIESGKYHFWSYEHMYTNGHSSPAAADFISFVKDQHSSIDQLGFISLSDMNVANR